MANDHGCAYVVDGLRCPRLGIFCDSSRVDPATARWWCNLHRHVRNRGTKHADKQLLIAVMDDVREGRMPRGSTMIARPVDDVFQRELERLDLHRGVDESRPEFIARCKAKMKRLNLRMDSDRDAQRRRQALELLEAGEDPSDAMDTPEDDMDTPPW